MKRFYRTFLVGVLAVAMTFALGSLSFAGGSDPAAAPKADRGLVVTGGTEGTDYTYEDGVLTFLKDGAYTLSMADGVSSTTDIVEIHQTADFSSLELTLDNVTFETTASNWNMIYRQQSDRTPFDLTFNLVGTNNFTAPSNPINITRNHPTTTIKGDGTLNITASGTPNDNGLNSGNLILESGTVNINNSSISTGEGVEIKGGTLNIDNSPAGAQGAIYANGHYKQTGGTVNITGASCPGIFVAGVNNDDNPGIEVLGGELSIETSLYGIRAGYRYQKDVIIDTDDTVSIDAGQVGILLATNSDMEMNGGLLKINSGLMGIYVNGSGSTGSELRVNGGETEITTPTRAIGLGAADSKTIDFGADYFHKDYDGPDQASREEVSDEDLFNASGNTDKYVLITPAWRITYDLGDGALEEGKTNPVKYSRVDEFTLNDPVPNSDSKVFTGWTGTDLDSPTTPVTVAEGSKGDRTYTANYKGVDCDITFDPAGGTIDGSDEAYTETHEMGETITVPAAPTREGYKFKHWDVDGTAYQPGDEYTVEGDATFTAVWEKIEGGGDDEEDVTPGTDDDKTPGTGDEVDPLPMEAVMGLSLLVMALTFRRRRNG